MICASTLKFNHKQVLLLGLANPITIKEAIQSSSLKLELHDMDEIIRDDITEDIPIINVTELIQQENERLEQILQKEQEKLNAQNQQQKGKGAPTKTAPKKDDKKADKGKGKEKKKEVKAMDLIFDPQPKVNDLNYGISHFQLTDLLKDQVKDTKLRSYVYPNKVFEDKMSSNLDLNTTAKMTFEKSHLNTSYLDNETYIAVTIKIRDAIGKYYIPPEPKPIEEQPVDTKKPTKPQAKGKAGSKKVEPEEQKEVAPAVNFDSVAHFERVVFILPYKCHEFIESIQNTVNEINIKNMNIHEGGVRALSAYSLSESERANKNLDFIGGFEIMDDEFRLFVLEGIGKSGMKEFEEKTRIHEPNSDTFKILRNTNLNYKDRLYQDFGLQIKKIRLRENLREFLMKPDIYNRVKLPDSICNTFIQFNEIRKCISLRQVSQTNLFPQALLIIHIERKYSDSLTFEDLNGYKEKNRKKSQMMKSQKDLGSPVKRETIDPKVRFQLTFKDNEVSQVESNMEPEMSSDHQCTKPIYPFRMTKVKTDYNKPVYLYGPQHLNYYAQQKRELREQIQKDKNHFYTYSMDYLTLSIDPYDMDDELKREMRKKKEILKNQGRDEFRHIPHKDIDRLPKRLHPTQIAEIGDNPFYEQKAHTKEILKNTRGLPLKEMDKEEFQKYIPKIGTFGQYEVLQAEKITADQKEKMEREHRKHERDTFLQSLVGKEFIYTNSVLRNRDSQLDKLQGLLVDSPKKYGLRINKNRVASSKITQDLYLKKLPSSMFIGEPYIERQAENILNRKEEKSKNVDPKPFFKYNADDIMFKNCISKPVKNLDIPKIQ